MEIERFILSLTNPLGVDDDDDACGDGARELLSSQPVPCLLGRPAKLVLVSCPAFMKVSCSGSATSCGRQWY